MCFDCESIRSDLARMLSNAGGWIDQACTCCCAVLCCGLLGGTNAVIS